MNNNSFNYLKSVCSAKCFYTESINNKILQNKLNILYLNIRSLGKNLEHLTLLLESQLKNNNIIHILAFCETWLTLNKYILPLNNYTFVGKNSIRKSGIGGVCFYIHNTLNYNIVEQLSFSNNCLEIITMDLITNSRNITLSCIYRHPQTSIDELNNCLNLLDNSKKSDHIILGDINIDLLKPDLNSSEYYNNLLSHGFLPNINIPTRVSKTSKTLIDHIFTKSNFIENHCQILQNDISDHYPIITSINLTGGNINKKVNYLIRNIRDINFTLMKNDLNKIVILDTENINEQFTKLNNDIVDVINKYAPKCK